MMSSSKTTHSAGATVSRKRGPVGQPSGSAGQRHGHAMLARFLKEGSWNKNEQMKREK